MAKAMLITGGLGFIGQHLANKLLDEGYKVYVVDNDPRAWYHNNVLSDRANQIEWINRDLTHHKFPISDDVEGIFHLAGAVGTKRIIKKGAQMVGDNVDIMANVIRSVKMTRRNIKTVFASTNEVYPLDEFVNMPYQEDENISLPLAPTDRWSYAFSKLVGEWMLQTSGLHYSIARLCNVYGEGMKQDYVVKNLIKQMIDNPGEMNLHSSLDTRPFTYVSDTVAGLLAIMQSPISHGETYNVGIDESVAIWALAEQIAIQGDFDITFRMNEGEWPEYRSASVSKIKEKLGWEAQVSLADGLDRTIKWYKEHYV